MFKWIVKVFAILYLKHHSSKCMKLAMKIVEMENAKFSAGIQEALYDAKEALYKARAEFEYAIEELDEK